MQSNFVAKVIEFDNLIVIVYHKNHNPYVLYREYKDPKVYLTMDTHYVKAAYLFDPFYQASQGGIQSGIHQIFELAPDQFKQTSYFREYYRDTTLVDEFAIFSRLGHSSLSISPNLNISKETVKVFRKQLYLKCNISSQAELFALLMPIFSVL